MECSNHSERQLVLRSCRMNLPELTPRVCMLTASWKMFFREITQKWASLFLWMWAKLNANSFVWLWAVRIVYKFFWEFHSYFLVCLSTTHTFFYRNCWFLLSVKEKIIPVICMWGFYFILTKHILSGLAAPQTLVARHPPSVTAASSTQHLQSLSSFCLMEQMIIPHLFLNLCLVS